MADSVHLFLKFSAHPLYPKDREFTEYEAWLDILVHGHPNGIDDRSMSEMAYDWMWTKSKVQRFLVKLFDLGLIDKSDQGTVINKHLRWYGLPNPEVGKERELAQMVIDAFNKTFDRKLQLNEYRLRTIIARFKEGRSLTPKIELKQFQAVFTHKKKEWDQDVAMSKYLEIETLCAKKHFMKYLDAARAAVKKQGMSGETIQGSILKSTT